MKVHIIGGGPAGLYFAILMKKAWPQTRITVFERNRPDDTFGFGVVFSDQTLEAFESYDRETYRQIVGHFAYWDDIEIHFRGTTHRIGGNGFCGTSRTMLLKILGRRAHSLGIEHQVRLGGRSGEDHDRAAPISWSPPTASTRAPASCSRTSSSRPSSCGPTTSPGWARSGRWTPSISSSRETPHGIFIAHCYQYQPGRSTWVMETDPETFKRAGLDKLDEAASARFLEGVFAEELDGHKLITNRSIWRNFPTIRCERWTADNIVLIGDAKATAHFSIGSGTKLAMEDAIALYEAFRATGGRDVKAALARFESARREEVEKTQHSADVSLVWFEHVKRFWDMDPTRFAFGLMTRSKAITYDNLALRAPEFVKLADKLVARDAQAQGFEVDTAEPVRADVPAVPAARHDARQPRGGVADVPVFGGRRHADRLAHGALRLARDRRRRPDVHRDDLRVRATPASRHGCTGLYNDAQEAAWKRIVDFVHANSAAKFCLQLGHAGRKGATKLMWEGMDQPLPRRRLADHGGLAAALLSAQPGAARDDAAPTWTR